MGGGAFRREASGSLMHSTQSGPGASGSDVRHDHVDRPESRLCHRTRMHDRCTAHQMDPPSAVAPDRIMEVVDCWEPGELIVRREVLGLAPGFHPELRPAWYGKPWLALPVYVVEDTHEQLVTYTAEAAEIGYVEGDWPTPDGKHPWHAKRRWEGHGCLMVQRPGDHHAVWHFWTGEDRAFGCWYINLQADVLRTEIGYDTQDFELDLVVFPDGNWIVKDLDVLDDRVAEGRFTAELVDWIRTLGDDLERQLAAGDHWWDHRWADWAPDPTWIRPSLPEHWV